MPEPSLTAHDLTAVIRAVARDLGPVTTWTHAADGLTVEVTLADGRVVTLADGAGGPVTVDDGVALRVTSATLRLTVFPSARARADAEPSHDAVCLAAARDLYTELHDGLA